MTERTTEAGRRLASPDPKDPPYNRMGFHIERCALWRSAGPCDCGLANEVLAIEAEARDGHALHFDPDCEECAYLARPTRETLTAAEARADLAARIEERVAALPTWDKRSVPGGLHVNRAAVLAIVREEASLPPRTPQPDDDVTQAPDYRGKRRVREEASR